MCCGATVGCSSECRFVVLLLGCTAAVVREPAAGLDSLSANTRAVSRVRGINAQWGETRELKAGTVRAEVRTSSTVQVRPDSALAFRLRFRVPCVPAPSGVWWGCGWGVQGDVGTRDRHDPTKRMRRNNEFDPRDVRPVDHPRTAKRHRPRTTLQPSASRSRGTSRHSGLSAQWGSE